MKKEVKKTGVYIKKGSIYAETTKDKLTLVIPGYIIMSIIFYYVLVIAEARRPFETRSAEVMVGTLLDIGSPLFWAMIMIFVGVIDVMRLVILLIKEKRQKNKVE